MTISALQSGGGNSPALSNAIKSTGEGAANMKDEFLTLMVAQIQNQDPLDPVKGADYVAQLAQISTVQGIEEMNDLQNQNNILQDAMNVIGTTRLIGTNVSIPTDVIELDQAEVISGKANIIGSAANVKVIARDVSGEIVEEISLGQKSAGSHDFKLPELEKGAYSLEVVAINGDQTRSYKPALTRQINEVKLPEDGSKDIYLDVDGVGTVSLYTLKSFLGDKA